MKNRKINLYIDTTNSDETIVVIKRSDKEKTYKQKTDLNKSQNVLPLIEKSLKQEKLELSDLTHIEVNTGPGSFTGIRVGVSVANALAWDLNIPVNGKNQAVPTYQPSRFDE